jgi:UDP-N-acetylmuramoylalanine--D-glutamate ligase
MQSFKNRKVLIFGLGLNDGGLGMAEYFLGHGAKVTITDGKTEEQLKNTLERLDKYKENITLHLDGHIKEDFLENDIIIRNPAVKPSSEYLQIAKEAGKQIEMEMSFFHRYAPCPIVGVTGTRGKSTTTTLIYEFLKKKFGEKIFLGGNVGRSAVRELASLTDENIAVLELSSFQLDAMGDSHVSPHVAVVTNMFTDHQDWHADMNEYIEAKKNIYRYQNEDDYLVVNIDNDITKNFVKDCNSNVVTYSLLDSSATYYMDSDMNIYFEESLLFSLNEKDVVLRGKHNRYNILAAIATSRIYDIEESPIKDVLVEFKGVHGRQELVRELNGIKFYNDTTATSIEAVKAMFERFGDENKGKIIMISGGVDKGLDYSLLVDDMKKYLKALILLEGSASERIYENIKDFENVYKYYADFKKAIQKAYEVAESGDMIILCPGGSSFNMFVNEFDRGSKYVSFANELK